MENLFTFSTMQYYIVAHALALGYAVMIATLLYFAFTYNTTTNKYKISSALSIVVMVSAFLILYHQYTSWTGNFYFDGQLGEFVKNPGTLFTNGYRYLNRLIDVPMLLLQLTFVVSIPKLVAKNTRTWFVVSGVLMIITGYIGQFYETSADKTMYWLFFWISTGFFLHVYYLLYQTISNGLKDKIIGSEGRTMLNTIRYIFLGAWMLYPIAYLMPVISMTARGVVARQLLFTVADITSKVVYGIILMNLAQLKSVKEGYDYNKLES